MSLATEGLPVSCIAHPARVAPKISGHIADIAADGYISVDGGLSASGLEVAHLAAVGTLDTCH